jgi:hypothetical protein
MICNPGRSKNKRGRLNHISHQLEVTCDSFTLIGLKGITGYTQQICVALHGTYSLVRDRIQGKLVTFGMPNLLKIELKSSSNNAAMRFDTYDNSLT